MRRTPRTYALCVALAGVAAASAAWAQTFRAQSDLVVLQVAVHDRHGGPATNLAQPDFRVTEDKTPQALQFFLSEDRPVAIGLVVDNSTSMGPKRNDVIVAAEAFAKSSNPLDALFTVNFNERVSFGLPDDVPFTSDLAVLRTALTGITARGQTALYDGIAAALAHVSESALDQKVLVVVSDGADNRSTLTFKSVLDQALRSNVVIYTVGIFDAVEGGDRKALERLADATGGFAFFPETTPEIRHTLDQISVDVRHRYTLGYVSTNHAHNGALRQVKVTAIDPQSHRALDVRARTGYLAPTDTGSQQQ